MQPQGDTAARWLALLLFTAIAAQGQPALQCGAVSESTTPSAIARVRTASFPELASADIGSRAFHSQSDFWRTRFVWPRFFGAMRMRYVVEFNPEQFDRGVPEDAACAIIAHELAHAAALNRGSRIRRLGLIKLVSKRRMARFERGTDLEAIGRGYAQGLTGYRRWLYANIPPGSVSGKRRDYFSPEEIELLERRLRETPNLMSYFRKHVPLNAEQIERTSLPVLVPVTSDQPLTGGPIKE